MITCPNCNADNERKPNTFDLTDWRFGQLTVIRFAGYQHKQAFWLTRCDCGNERTIRANSLLRGNSSSCGCQRKGFLKHGYARTDHKTATYRSWIAMRTRCGNPNIPKYQDYGGRGIRVCERWNSFESFLADMGERPPGMSIDRIDNDGDYCPENCKWSTNKEQCRNQRWTVRLTYNGETKTRQEWCEVYGIKLSTLRERLLRGWTLDQVFNTPNDSYIVTLTYRGETKTRHEWCEIYGINFSTLRSRIKRGWTLDQVFGASLYQKPTKE